MSKTNKKRDAIKSGIQKLRLETPASDFTTVIMKEILADPDNEVAVASPLKSLLQRHALENAPDGFTSKVVAGLRAQDSRLEFTPVIGRTIWVLISLTLTSLGIWQLFSNQTAPVDPGLTSYFIEFGSKLTTTVTTIPSLYIITFVAVAILLLADHLLRSLKGGAKYL